MSTKDLKAKLRPRRPAAQPLCRGLSTGLTLVNLALTDSPNEGFAPGCYYLLVGDSRAGKTFLALTALAEASISPAYKDYRLIYDAPERGARMDMRQFFGAKMAGKLEWRYSETVEEMYFALDSIADEGKPFIYVEDSESALSSEAEGDHFQESKKAHARGKAGPGSYGDGKAKKHSSSLRQILPKLEKTGSILLVVSQTRDNIGFGAQFNPKVRSGGRALTFYATGELWFSVKGQLTRQVAGKSRKIGTELEVRVKKNRGTGREPTVVVHHYPSHGFDDIGSNIAYLEEEGKIKDGRAIIAGDSVTSRSPEELAQQIEERNLEPSLRLAVSETWDEIEEKCRVKRKGRYG